ncbi:hypothetical protein ACU8KH_01610 [Lachancea thermotolerans]
MHAENLIFYIGEQPAARLVSFAISGILPLIIASFRRRIAQKYTELGEYHRKPATWWTVSKLANSHGAYSTLQVNRRNALPLLGHSRNLLNWKFEGLHISVQPNLENLGDVFFHTKLDSFTEINYIRTIFTVGKQAILCSFAI